MKGGGGGGVRLRQAPPVGTLVMRVLRRPGSEGFGSPPVGTLLMRVPWGA